MQLTKNWSVIVVFCLSVAAFMVALSFVVSAEEPVRLVYWSNWNEPEGQARVIKSWIEDFMSKNPQITIEAVWNGRQNQTLVRNALSTGTQIDLIDANSDALLSGLVKEGQAYLLNDFLAQKALDQDVPIKEVFLPGIIDLYKQDDHAYLWPHIYNTVQFWYNKDIFEEAGVTPPNTWKEFLAVNDAILKAGYVPIAAEGDIASYQLYYFTYLVARAKAPGFLRSSVADKTGTTWRDPVYLDTARKIRELWNRGHIPAESVGYLWPAAQQTLAFGEAAMELCGSWLPIELADATGEDFRWGAFNFPAIEGGEGAVDDLEATVISFMLPKTSKHYAEAFEFLRFIMTKENQQKMADESLVGVTRRDVQWAEAITDGARAAANATTVYRSTDGAIAENGEFVSNILRSNVRLLFVGKLTPEEFVEKMANDAAEYWASR